MLMEEEQWCASSQSMMWVRENGGEVEVAIKASIVKIRYETNAVA